MDLLNNDAIRDAISFLGKYISNYYVTLSLIIILFVISAIVTHKLKIASNALETKCEICKNLKDIIVKYISSKYNAELIWGFTVFFYIMASIIAFSFNQVESMEQNSNNTNLTIVFVMFITSVVSSTIKIVSSLKMKKIISI